MAEQLRRSLGLTSLVFYGVGTIIGAGIYSVIGAAAGEAGSLLWVSFALAAVVALITALSYAELASMIPKAGAEYQFLKRAFPGRPFIAFMGGWLIALNAAATAATVALAFAGYLDVFLPAPHILTAFALLAFCTAINIAGIREATWVSIAIICVEVAGLLLFIWTGFGAGGSVDKPPSAASPSLGGALAATALVFFVFIGFEDVANLAEESKRPEQDTPRALVIAVFTTALLYMLVAFAALSLAAPQMMATSKAPLTEAAALAAPWRGTAMAIAALFATVSTALITLVSISRLLFGMARDGDMPRALAKTLTKRRTPWLAALALFAAAAALLPLGEVKIVASVSSFGVLLVFSAVQIAMIVLRFRDPDAKRPFRVPGSIGRLPVPPAIGVMLTLALATQLQPVVYAIGGGAVALGLVVYFLMGRSSRKNVNSVDVPRSAASR